MGLPQNAETIWNDLLAQGATPIEAAGIMGNMVQESGGNPEEQVIDSNGAYSRGLIMWNDKGAGAGVNWSQYITGNVDNDIKAQVALLASQGHITQASGATPQAAALSFVNTVERPDPAYANYPNRENSAEAVYAAAQSGNWNQTPNPNAVLTGNATPGQTGNTGSGGGTGSGTTTPGTGNQASASQFEAVGGVGTVLQYLDGFLNPTVTAVPGIINIFTGVNSVVTAVATIADRAVGVVVGAVMVYISFRILSGGQGGRTILGAANTGLRAGELQTTRQREGRLARMAETAAVVA